LVTLAKHFVLPIDIFFFALPNGFWIPWETVLAFDEGPDRKMGLTLGNLPFDSLFKVFLLRTFVQLGFCLVDFDVLLLGFRAMSP
jgi:hypothetical protein